MCGENICLFFGQVRLIPAELHQVRLKPFAFIFAGASLSHPSKRLEKALVGFKLDLRTAKALGEMGRGGRKKPQIMTQKCVSSSQQCSDLWAEVPAPTDIVL